MKAVRWSARTSETKLRRSVRCWTFQRLAATVGSPPHLPFHSQSSSQFARGPTTLLAYDGQRGDASLSPMHAEEVYNGAPRGPMRDSCPLGLIDILSSLLSPSTSSIYITHSHFYPCPIMTFSTTGELVDERRLAERHSRGNSVSRSSKPERVRHHNLLPPASSLDFFPLNPSRLTSHQESHAPPP
jgi:hypothetical protein